MQKPKISTLVVVQKYDAEDFSCREVHSADLIAYDPAKETPEQAVQRIYPDRDFENNFLIVGEIEGDFEKFNRPVWQRVNAGNDTRERYQEAEYNARQKPPQNDAQFSALLTASMKVTAALMNLVIKVLKSLLSSKQASELKYSCSELPLPAPGSSAPRPDPSSDDPSQGFVLEPDEEDSSPRPGM